MVHACGHARGISVPGHQVIGLLAFPHQVFTHASCPDQIAGVQELVEDGVTGLTVPPGDIVTLSDRMARLMSDPDLSARMGEAGRKAVEREHDIAREGAWLADLFRKGGPDGQLRP